MIPGASELFLGVYGRLRVDTLILLVVHSEDLVIKAFIVLMGKQRTTEVVFNICAVISVYPTAGYILTSPHLSLGIFSLPSLD